MPGSLIVLRVIAAAGVVIGAGIAYWEPRFPLLIYWLVLATVLGIGIATVGTLTGLRQRAKWLVVTNAIIVVFALATTQLAARRAISSTHLRYQGVLLEGIPAFTVGAGTGDVDVRLQSQSSTPAPWSIRVSKSAMGWSIEPLGGIEQLRLSPQMKTGSGRELSVAQSTILRSPGDWVSIADPGGAVVDTLRLAAGEGGFVLGGATGNQFRLKPVNEAIDARYRRQLRSGVALSSLDGKRSAPAAYERFVRVQELSRHEVVNGFRLTPG